MGLLFWLLFSLMELAYDAWTIVKQREKELWLRNRLILRGAQVIVFLLLMLLPGNKLDMRFTMFFGLLLVQTLIAFVGFLVGRKKAEGNRKVGITVAKAVGTIALYLMMLAPAFIFTGYEGLPVSGSYEVAQTQAILVDPDRVETFETDGSCREVPVHFYYPKNVNGQEKFPLVIFSHGAFGYYQSNTSSYMELASNGYVVISLDHPYHSFFTKDTSGKLITVNPQFINEVYYINEDETPEEEIFELSSKWLELRTQDICFVLDEVKKAADIQALNENWFYEGKEEAGEELQKAVSMADGERIGLFGHSLGGAASVNVGRIRDDIDAVIDLDGTMMGEETGYENGAYQFQDEPYPVALLSVDNEKHHIDGKSLGSYYVNNVVIDQALDGRNTYIKGSAHFTFTDLPLFAPALAKNLEMGTTSTIDDERGIRIVNEIVLMFFNHYLKNEGEVTLLPCYE